VWTLLRVRTISVALKVSEVCKLKYILIQNFGDANCIVGYADTAGLGAEVDSEGTEHVLKQRGDQQTC
jgi:hypothetical protein